VNKKQKRVRQRDQIQKAAALREREKANRVVRERVRVELERQAWEQAWRDLQLEQGKWLEKRTRGFDKLWHDLQWEQAIWLKAHELAKADLPTHTLAGSW
jgi:phage protein D